MIRCGTVKLGEKLQDIADVKGKVQWQRLPLAGLDGGGVL